jgi:tryptophan 2,3-dioxygenase
MTVRNLAGATETERPLTYADYLQTSTLLSLQETRTPTTADRAVVLAEHFFIIAHQSCELWLKQVISDLNASVDVLSPPCDIANIELCAEFLQRADELLRVLHGQVIALEQLPLRHFAAFRPYLGTASGAQSQQFILLSRLLGSDRQTGRLYEAFRAAVAYHNLSVEEVCRRGVAVGALHRVAEALLDVGNGYWRWKIAHLGLMTRMVGTQEGTGGTSGAEYLARRITLPFPELRQLRGQVHAEVTSYRG